MTGTLRTTAALALVGLLLLTLGPSLASSTLPRQPLIHFKPQPEAGAYRGDVVAFRFDETTGILSNYSLAASPSALVDSLRLGGPTGRPTTEGGLFTAQGSGTLLMIHDNPTLLLQVLARAPATLSLRLGTLAVQDSDLLPLGRGLLLTDGNLRGVLFATNGTVTAHDKDVIVALPEGAAMVFRLKPPDDDKSPGLGATLMSEIARKRIGAEVSVDLRDGQPEVDAVAYRPGLQVSATRIAHNALELQVADQNRRGTILLLRLAPGLVQAEGSRALRISLDNDAVPDSPTPEGVLQDEGPGTSYYPVVDRSNVLLLLVYIPHFSAHSLVVEALSPTALIVDPPSLAILAAGVAIVATAALVMFRRR